MSGPTRGAAHVVRATALAVAVLALAAGAHVVGGAALPTAGPMVVLALGTAWVCAWATRVRLAAPAVLALLGAGQLALHQAFAGLAAAPGCLPAPAVHAGHGHLSAACEPAAHVATGGGGTAMLVAHAVATLLAGALLARGEAAVWALWHWLRPVPALPAARGLPPARRPLPAPAAAVPAVRGAVLRVAPRRGPPVAPRAA